MSQSRFLSAPIQYFRTLFGESEADWVQVIETLYENGGIVEVAVSVSGADMIEVTGKSKQDIALFEKLQEQSGVKIGERGNRPLIESLIDWGLIELDLDSTYGLLRLTKSGFEVAHDRQLKRRQFSINKGILLAALLSTTGFFLSEWPPEGIPILKQYSFQGFVIGLIFALFFGGWLVKELLNLQSIFTTPRFSSWSDSLNGERSDK